MPGLLAGRTYTRRYSGQRLLTRGNRLQPGHQSLCARQHSGLAVASDGGTEDPLQVLLPRPPPTSTTPAGWGDARGRLLLQRVGAMHIPHAEAIAEAGVDAAIRVLLGQRLLDHGERDELGVLAIRPKQAAGIQLLVLQPTPCHLRNAGPGVRLDLVQHRGEGRGVVDFPAAQQAVLDSVEGCRPQGGGPAGPPPAVAHPRAAPAPAAPPAGAPRGSRKRAGRCCPT